MEDKDLEDFMSRKNELIIKQDKSDSVEIKCNAKQQFSWEVKCYGDFSSQEGIEETIKRIENTIEKLKLRLLK